MNRKNKIIEMKNLDKGFTLMELLVTIAIIGILSAISLFAVSDARKSARDGRRKADLESIRSALELYRADCGSYPATITVGTPLSSAAPPTCPALGVVYMQRVPGDPVGNATYYYNRPTNVTYTLCARLEEIPPTYDNTGCGSCSGGTCYYKVVSP